MSDNCWTCDRPRATEASEWPDSAKCFTYCHLQHAEGPSEACPHCCAYRDCADHEVDWRSEALRLRDEVAGLRVELSDAIGARGWAETDAAAQREIADVRTATLAAARERARALHAEIQHLTIENARLREALAVAGVQEARC